MYIEILQTSNSAEIVSATYHNLKMGVLYRNDEDFRNLVNEKIELYYENFLQIHYKIFKNNFISQTYFISILHKQKISHQTTDDVPLLLI